METLDVDQVLDLVFNGFGLEHAVAAVTESHGQTDEWASALLAATKVHPEYTWVSA
jgi:hypothetical protein